MINVEESLFTTQKIQLLSSDYKFLFLKPYGEKRVGHILVIRQHLHTDKVDSYTLSYEEIQKEFHPYGGGILGFVNKPQIMRV